MKLRSINELWFYSYRYWFGYGVVAAFMIYFLSWQIGSVPPGLSQPEIAAAAHSSSLANFIELPIRPLHTLLQWASMSVFGVSELSIRIPDVILSLGVAFGLYWLLRRWFGKPTSLLSTAIFISADWFLFVARLGAGTIEFSLWLIIALLSFTKLLEHKTKWILFFCIALCGLLLNPFGIYAVIALVISLILCRVFRERTLEAPLSALVPGVLLIVITIFTIGFASFRDPNVLRILAGLPILPTASQYLLNLFNNTGAVVAVLPGANPIVSPTGIFFVRFFELIFIVFGILMFWKTRINRLNLTVLAVSVVLVIVGGFSEGPGGSGLLLVPAAVFMTAGVRHFLNRWQKMFPRNPYAQVAAYAPLIVLFICAVSLHYVSYFVLWPGQSSTHAAFTPDFSLVKNELQNEAHRGKICFIDSENKEFNTLLTASNTHCKPSFDANQEASVLILRPASATTAQKLEATALTAPTTHNNIRWLVVKN